MRGVVIVFCDRCHGTGGVGLATMRVRCPECHGSGQTTINELEVSSGGD